MRLSHLAAAFAVAATAAAPMARAFPIGPSPAPSSNPVIEVRGLCGLGWHRELDGACYRNGVPYGYYGIRMDHPRPTRRPIMPAAAG